MSCHPITYIYSTHVHPNKKEIAILLVIGFHIISCATKLI